MLLILFPYTGSQACRKSKVWELLGWHTTRELPR
jgi:hypothetical protein